MCFFKCYIQEGALTLCCVQDTSFKNVETTDNQILKYFSKDTIISEYCKHYGTKVTKL